LNKNGYMSEHSLISKISVSPLKAALVQPFRTALGDHDSLENVLFTLELKDGTQGFGEAAVATHITGETVEQTTRNLKLVGRSLTGRDASDYLKISAQLHERLLLNKCALAAIETALIDALTRQKKIPLWKFFGTRARKLASDITIVIADLKETEESLRKYFKQGFRAFKVKIGRDEELDYERVLTVKRLAPRSKIYLDANQGYSAGQTLRFLKRIERAGVRPDLIEQPVPREDWEGLKKVTRSTKVPVCADESARSLSDVVRIIKEKAAPVVNIKLMKTGIFESCEIALLARKKGVRLMIGGMMETSLAMTASAHMAAGLGGFDFIDLDTPFFIKDGIKRNPFLNARGVYDFKKSKRGIGITPDEI
jgi:L-alanine-DL-glutamate epimerase-like enolase superfamily enzyme